MSKVLVIGASGFVGGHLALALLAEQHRVRCLTRNVERVKGLAKAGCEIVLGDICDVESMRRAVESVNAVYVSIHTLAPQPGSTAGQRFMEIEMNGLRNIVTACRTHGVRRLISVTGLGIEQQAKSEWVRERWQAEQFLLNSGLDVTTIRPGQIVGFGGMGFNMMVRQARSLVALRLGNGTMRMQNIALDDLLYYLVGVLNDPRTYGQRYDVGCDDILTADQMIDVTAAILGRRPPTKISIPPALLGALAPLIERIAKAPKGAIKGIADCMDQDMIGDPKPIRAILPRPPVPYRQAVERALAASSPRA